MPDSGLRRGTSLPGRALYEGLLGKWWVILTQPGSFFASMEDDWGWGAPLGFGFAMAGLVWLAVAVLATLEKLPTGRLDLGPFVALAAGKLGALPPLAGFGGGLVVWLLGRVLGGPRATYVQAAAVCGYALAVVPLIAAAVLSEAAAPHLAVAAPPVFVLYGFYIVARGMIALHRAQPVATFVILGAMALAADAAILRFSPLR